MSPAAIATAAVVGVASLVAALNLWIFLLRRTDRGHLWLGVAALGVAFTAAPTVLLYDATTATEAIAARRTLNLGLLVHVVGFTRFCEGLLGVSLRGTERASVLGLGFLYLASFVPGLTFSGEPVVRPVLGGTYVDAEATAFAGLVLLVFVGVVVRIATVFRRHARPQSPTWSGIPTATAVWMACALADMASSMGLAELPSLFPVGQLGFVVAFTGSRIRHFVGAMTEVEARTGLLEHLVTERTQALREKELQLARGEPFAAAGTLAAGLAHEINNPVAFVLANLNHLQSLRKEGGSQAEIDEVLLETQEGVARLHAIVEELLRLARSGGRRNEPVDLAQVVTAALPLVRHEAGPGIRVEADLPRTPAVSGDAGQLGQVVLNLLQNAIHALAGSGRDGRVRVALRAMDGHVELCVEDDGPGIAAGDVTRVFEPFFTTKPQGQGTGLGLAVTREIVSRHGGDIEVESRATGTRFRVRLPTRDEATPGNAGPS
ncbi:MAG: HAMP domain-containing sensor histidine kinase [Myxococcota bacterium]